MLGRKPEGEHVDAVRGQDRQAAVVGIDQRRRRQNIGRPPASPPAHRQQQEQGRRQREHHRLAVRADHAAVEQPEGRSPQQQCRHRRCLGPQQAFPYCIDERHRQHQQAHAVDAQRELLAPRQQRPQLEQGKVQRRAAFCRHHRRQKLGPALADVIVGEPLVHPHALHAQLPAAQQPRQQHGCECRPSLPVLRPGTCAFCRHLVPCAACFCCQSLCACK